MIGKKPRMLECSVTHETVSIRLRSRRAGGFNGETAPFVQCNQAECQYVDANTPPCPLTLELFAEELQAREERARTRRETEY